VLPPVDVFFAIDVKLVDEGTDWAAWMTGIFTAVLAIGAWVALFSLKDAKRTRHAATITDLSRRWDEPAATDARRRTGDYDAAALLGLVRRVYLPAPTATDEERLADVDELFRLGRWVNLLETIGVLFREKALSDRVIFRLWGGQIVSAWTKWEKPVVWMRDWERRPGIYENFQCVDERMRKMLARELKKSRASGGRPGHEPPAGAGYSADKNAQSSVLHSNETGTRFHPGRILGFVAAALAVSALWGIFKRVIRV
jgi:hypothetical protein